MSNFTIKVYEDRFHSDLSRFRQRVYMEDLNCAEVHLREDSPAQTVKNSVSSEFAEDAYRFSYRKWSRNRFDCIFALMDDDGSIVGISGAKAYGRYLRVSMNMYLLKSARKKYLNVTYKRDGFFDRQIQYAKTHQFEALFFTIHPHNRKTRALLKNHQGRKISTAQSDEISFHQDLIAIERPRLFNCVMQHFFFYPLGAEKSFDIESIVGSP